MLYIFGLSMIKFLSNQQFLRSLLGPLWQEWDYYTESWPVDPLLLALRLGSCMLLHSGKVKGKLNPRRNRNDVRVELSTTVGVRNGIWTHAHICGHSYQPWLWENIIFQINASNYGVNAVLSQMDAEGLDHPVAYFSHKLLTWQRAETLQNWERMSSHQAGCQSISNVLTWPAIHNPDRPSDIVVAE